MYRNEFRGGEIRTELVRLGYKDRGPHWLDICNDFPHSVVVRRTYADCGWAYLWRPYPEIPLSDAIEFHELSRFRGLDINAAEDVLLMATSPWRHPEAARDTFFLLLYEDSYGYLPDSGGLCVADTTT